MSRLPPALHDPAHWLIRAGLAALFIWTGAQKLIEPGSFAAAIANYRVLPDLLVGFAAVALPVLELVAGFALLWPLYAQGAALIVGALLAVFAAAMAQSKLRGIDLDCGCFGAAQSSQVSWLKVTLNVGLAMLALWTSRVRLSPPTRNKPGSATAAG
ncbi:MAG TPA: MauE/DoxX family redox-associated membrane protein [Polyangiaceae bacterium]|nr:MauE/DoxX family redox-associated membrane protein [Polyangiaceae bacterium]